jgi:hypothetical protein
VIASLYEHIEPIDRGKRYEDRLQAGLDERGAVGRVTGGGSQLNEAGGIAHADIEIELANLDEALGIVSEVLEAAGAPAGSELIDVSNSRVLKEFGTQQCVAVFLDGVTLPDEVYETLDFDAVVRDLGSAGGDASYRGFCLEPVLRRLPIGQNARVVVRYGKAAGEPRELRMPRR